MDTADCITRVRTAYNAEQDIIALGRPNLKITSNLCKDFYLILNTNNERSYLT